MFTSDHAHPMDDNSAAEFYNGLCFSDQARADRLDGALRLLITTVPDRKIMVIKMYRDMALAFGVEIGLREAKYTCDVIRERVATDTMRSMLMRPLGTPEWVRLSNLLNRLTPQVIRPVD